MQYLHIIYNYFQGKIEQLYSFLLQKFTNQKTIFKSAKSYFSIFNFNIGELYVRMLMNETNYPAKIIRPFNAYGEYQSANDYSRNNN